MLHPEILQHLFLKNKTIFLCATILEIGFLESELPWSHAVQPAPGYRAEAFITWPLGLCESDEEAFAVGDIMHQHPRYSTKHPVSSAVGSALFVEMSFLRPV